MVFYVKKVILFFTLVAIFGLTIWACKKNDNITKEYVDKDTLVQVLKHMYLTDGMLAITQTAEKYEETDSVSFYQYIFDKYDLTKARFDSAIFILSKHPEHYTEVYNLVIKELVTIEGEVNYKIQEKKHKEEEEREKNN